MMTAAHSSSLANRTQLINNGSNDEHYLNHILLMFIVVSSDYYSYRLITDASRR